MSLLVAIKSCQAHQAYHQAIRDTWGKFLPRVVFFMGDTPDTISAISSDEVVLDCPDDYMSLPFKTHKICEWAGDRFDSIYLCDNDTFINPRERIWSYFNYFDYAGCMNKLCDIGKTAYYKDHMGEYYNCHPWASGGIGYFLSKRAAQLVASQTPNVWAEDLWVGQILGPEIQAGRMTAKHLENFDQVAAWHFRRTRRYRSYNPEMMYRSWQLGSPTKMYEQDKDV